MMDWQTIDTAPKDCSVVGLLGESLPDLPFIAVLQWWDGETWRQLGHGAVDAETEGAWAMWSMHGEDWTSVEPTHWMPLPAPPLLTQDRT